MEEILAVPKVIDPMVPPFASPRENRAEYLRANKLGTVLGPSPYEGADLVSFGSNYRVLDHAKERVVYVMTWRTRKILGQDAAYQIYVWTDPGTPEMRGFAPKVFFEHLFSKTGLICTDREQTLMGRRFWGSVIQEALRRDLPVYFTKIMPPKKFTQIKTYSEFEALDAAGQIWTDDKKGRDLLLLISKEPLDIAKYETLAAILVD
jgi:hypothetical protein